MRTFKGHVGSVKSIRFDELRIATGAHDKVRIWDFTYHDKLDSKKVKNVNDEDETSRSPSKDIQRTPVISQEVKDRPVTSVNSLTVKDFHYGTPTYSTRGNSKEGQRNIYSSPRVKEVQGSTASSPRRKEVQGSAASSSRRKEVQGSAASSSPRGKDVQVNTATPRVKEMHEKHVSSQQVKTTHPDTVVTKCAR